MVVLKKKNQMLMTVGWKQENQLSPMFKSGVFLTEPSTICRLYPSVTPDFLLCSHNNYYGRQRVLSLERKHILF